MRSAHGFTSGEDEGSPHKEPKSPQSAIIYNVAKYFAQQLLVNVSKDLRLSGPNNHLTSKS